MNLEEFKIKKQYSEASGVMAVVDDNIYMELNDYGLYEEMLYDDSRGINDQAVFVSPNLNEDFDETIIANQLYENQNGIQFDKKLGYYNSLYVGYVKEGDFREKASSGGMGTWILKELLENKMVDYVIHVKKNSEEQRSSLFKYDISYNINEIAEGAKTKYYPVELSEVLNTVKKNPGRYVVVGIPSFIYAIRLLSKQDPVINERIKFTVGLICGHQKSSKFAELMAWQAGITPGNLVDIDFRHKLMDKPANNYGIRMRGIKNGKEYTIIKGNSELYGQNWGWGLFKPLASNFTDDVFNETADIVLGDAWLPEYISDSKGNNVVIIRNTEIKKIVDKAIIENKLVMDSVDVETIFNSQSSHYKHTHDELAYRLYMKDQSNEWRPSKRVSAHKNFSTFRKRVQELRNLIGKTSHVKYQIAVEKDDCDYFVKELSTYTDRYTKLYFFHNYFFIMKKEGFYGITRKILKKLNSKFTNN